MTAAEQLAVVNTDVGYQPWQPLCRGLSCGLGAAALNHAVVGVLNHACCDFLCLACVVGFHIYYFAVAVEGDDFDLILADFVV